MLIGLGLGPGHNAQQISLPLQIVDPPVPGLNSTARFAPGRTLLAEALPAPFPGDDSVAGQDLTVVMRLYTTAESLHDESSLSFFSSSLASTNMWLGPREFTLRPGAGFSIRGMTAADVDAADPAGAATGRWTAFMWRLYQDPGNIGGGNRRTIEIWRSDGTLITGTLGTDLSLNVFDRLSLDRIDGDIFDLALVTGDPAGLRTWLADDPGSGDVRPRFLADYDFAGDPACALHLHVPLARLDPGQPDSPATLAHDEPALRDSVGGGVLWSDTTDLPAWGPAGPFRGVAPAALTLAGTPEPGGTLTASRPATFRADGEDLTAAGRTSYVVTEADRGARIVAVDADGTRSNELLVPEIAPAVLGAAPGTWSVASGSGGRTLDLTTIFSGGSLSYEVSGALPVDQSFGTGLEGVDRDALHLDTDTTDPGDFPVTITARNSGGEVSHGVIITVTDMVLEDLFTRFPSWQGMVIRPARTGDHWADAAASVQTRANVAGDLVRVDFANGGGHARRADTGEARTLVDALTDDGLQIPLHHTSGVFDLVPDAPFEISQTHFVAAGVNNDSNGADTGYVMAQMLDAYTNRWSIGIASNRKASYRVRGAGGDFQTLYSEADFRDNRWGIMAVAVQGTDVSLSSAQGVEHFTLNEPVAPFTPDAGRPIHIGGRVRNNVETNRINGENGPAILIANAVPSETLTARILRNISDQVLVPSRHVRVTQEPTLTESGGVATFTPALTDSFAGDTVTDLYEFWWSGEGVASQEVSASVTQGAGGTREYVLPAGRGQFIVRQVSANAFVPAAQRVLHLDRDMGTPPGASGDDPARTFRTDRYAYNGQMYVTDAPVEWSHYVVGKGLGDVAIERHPTASLTAYYPEALDTDFTPERRINGAMRNPRYDQNRASAFDSGIPSHRYSRDRDISLQLPLRLADLADGDSLCISTSSDGGVPSKTLGITRRINVLTVVDATPYWDSLRPPTTWPAGEAKPALRQPPDAIIASLPGFDDGAYADAAPDIPALIERYAQPALPFIIPQHREHMRTAEGWNQYGRDFMGAVSFMMAWCMADRSVAEKRAFVNIMAQSGLDRYGVLRDARARAGLIGTSSISAVYESDGGHNNGYKPLTLFAMFALDQETAWMPCIRHNVYQEDDMVAYVTEYMREVSQGEHPTDTWSRAHLEDATPVSAGMVNGGVHPTPFWFGDRTNDDHRGVNMTFGSSGYEVAGQNGDKGYAVMLLFWSMGWQDRWADNPFALPVGTWTSNDGGAAGDGGLCYFDNQWRHYHIRAGLPDPWRFRGGTASAYEEVAGRATRALDRYAERQFVERIAGVYVPPWERAVA